MKQEKLSILDRFADLKVVVLGDVMLDVYDFCYTEHSRPSPEAEGKLVYHAARSLRTLGGAGNVAQNLASLGVSTVLISVCGADAHAFTLQKLADDMGVHHFLLQERARSTTVKTRLYIDDEYILRRDDETITKVSRETSASVLTEFMRELKGADAVVLSDYCKGFFSAEAAERMISVCRERNIPVIVDFKPKNAALFKGAHLMAPNRSEAQSLCPAFSEGVDLPAACKDLRDTLQCEQVAVTLGKDGICGYDGERFVHIPGNRVEAIDAVGCGDTGKAALAVACAAGLPFDAALSLANDAASIVVQKLGTASVTPAELRKFLEARP